MSRSRDNRGRRERKAGSDPELAKLDPYDTVIPDGEYSVAFLSQERFRLYSSFRWAVVMRIVEGEYLGLPLLFFFNIPRLRKWRTPSAKLSLAYEAATGKRAPARIAKVRPESFLTGNLLVARTRTVGRDSNGESRPVDARYSVIDRLVPQSVSRPTPGADDEVN
jgi:hypothetical protein